jgi:hypothetical protein
MARFGSTVAIVVDGHHSYKAGTTFADTKPNAIGNDVVWPQCGTSAGMSPGLIPLDGAATTIMNASRFAGISIPRPDGANSIG